MPDIPSAEECVDDDHLGDSVVRTSSVPTVATGRPGRRERDCGREGAGVCVCSTSTDPFHEGETHTERLTAKVEVELEVLKLLGGGVLLCPGVDGDLAVLLVSCGIRSKKQKGEKGNKSNATDDPKPLCVLV